MGRALEPGGQGLGKCPRTNEQSSHDSVSLALAVEKTRQARNEQTGLRREKGRAFETTAKATDTTSHGLTFRTPELREKPRELEARSKWGG